MVNPASINTSKARSIPMKSRTLLTAATLIAPLAFLGQGGVEASQAVYDVRGRKVDGYRGAPRDFIFRRNSAR